MLRYSTGVYYNIIIYVRRGTAENGVDTLYYIVVVVVVVVVVAVDIIIVYLRTGGAIRSAERERDGDRASERERRPISSH